MLEKIKEYLFDNTVYWVRHILVALLIMLIVGGFFGIAAGAAAAIATYAGREQVQYEMLGYFDVKGLAAPTVVVLLLYAILK